MYTVTGAKSKLPGEVKNVNLCWLNVLIQFVFTNNQLTQNDKNDRQGWKDVEFGVNV